MRGFSFSGKKASSQALDSVVGRTRLCFELFLSSISPHITAKHGAYHSNRKLSQSCYISVFLLTAIRHISSSAYVLLLCFRLSGLRCALTSLLCLYSVGASRRPVGPRLGGGWMLLGLGLSDRGGVYNVTQGTHGGCVVISTPFCVSTKSPCISNSLSQVTSLRHVMGIWAVSSCSRT